MTTLAFAVACGRPGAGPVGTEASLRSAIARLDSAWLAKDIPAVEAGLAPEYTYFTSNGGLNDKVATLAFLADTSYALTRARRTDVRVQLARTTAVISSRWEGEGRYRGEAVRDDQTCGQTWVWTAERWRLLAEYCINRPAPAPETA